MTYRQRLSATVRPEVLAAGRRAVSEGRAASLSEWVDSALARQAEHEQRLRALGEFISEYEREYGKFTPEELRDIRERLRERTIRVRPGRRAPATVKRGRRPR
jgi:hypothetical protein